MGRQAAEEEKLVIARFFQQIINSCGVVFRTFRAFFTRQIMGVRARIRRITSFSRQAAKLVPKAMSSVAVAGKKPTKREDFVETKRLFVAKSFLVLLLVGLVALGLLIYFVIWPWLVSQFFTAHLFQGDQAVAAYNGKVVVYYDEQKDAPKLQGKMQEGLVQGSGKAYDEEGRVLYEGNFADGLYEGKGSLYEEGVLVYEGDFSVGVFEGKGKLYQDGELVYEGGFSGGLREGTGTAYDLGEVCYKGEFAQGLYQGQGTSYYPNGAVQYRGGFLQGKYDTEGTLYYENGQLQYKGQFLEGLYDQQGVLYNPDGTLLYEGGFLLGVYSGEGKLQLDPQLRLTGTFEAGEPVGDVTIHRGGRLYYQGQVEELTPHGEGTLFATTGAVIYQGAMLHGAPDLGALLGKTAEEARMAFGEAPLQETQGEKNGFSIINKDLGATLFCTYKTEENEPTVYYVYAYEQGADAFANAMAWQNATQYEEQAQGYEKRQDKERAVFTGGVPYPNGTYQRTAYYYEDHVFVGWSKENSQEWLMIEWVTGQDLPSGSGAEAAGANESAARLDNLLGDLGLAEKTDAGQATPNQYYGQQAPASLISEESAQQTQQMDAALLAMADYYLQAETRQALEEQASLKSSLLQTEQKKLSMGTGSQETVDALAGQVSKLELGASRAAVAMEKAQMAAEPYVTGKLADYDVSAALFLADPSTLDVAALKSAGEEQAVQLALLDLELAYQEMQQAQKDYEAACGAAKQVQADYDMGKADEAARCDALCAQSEAAVALQQAIHACVSQMIGLNTLTNGYLANEYGWLDALQ